MKSDMRAPCPACGEGYLEIITEDASIPNFGKVVISTIHCEKCGYRSSDVVPVEDRAPARYRVEVNGIEDLSIRVVRASTSTLTIPELGITVDPGSANEGYITNVEGIMVRIMGILDQIIRDLEERSADLQDSEVRKERAEQLRSRIERITKGNISADGPFTIIIEDPHGNSALIEDRENEKVIREELTEKEIMDILRERYI